MNERLVADLSAADWQRVDQIALWIHSGRNVSELQEGVLVRLTELIPRSASFFDLCYEKEGRLLFFDPVSTTISEEDLSDYYQRYEVADYVAWCFTAKAPVIYRDSDMISDEAREASLIYREWMEPLGLYNSIGSTVVHDRTIFGSITLFRARGTEDFSDRDMAVLARVNEHLAVHMALIRPGGVFPDGFDEELASLSQHAKLTERERDVLRLVTQGLTNREVGRDLFISESTVKKHIHALFRKLGVDNRVQMMRLAYRGQG